MPESVDRPAPVSTTSRPLRRISGTERSRASTVTDSARVALPGLGPALLRLDLAVLRRGSRHELLEQVLGHVGDLVDGTVEGVLVRARRLGRPADLAHVLQRGVVDLLRRGGRLEVVERADVAAHASSLRGTGGAHTVRKRTESPATSTTLPS